MHAADRPLRIEVVLDAVVASIAPDLGDDQQIVGRVGLAQPRRQPTLLVGRRAVHVPNAQTERFAQQFYVGVVTHPADPIGRAERQLGGSHARPPQRHGRNLRQVSGHIVRASVANVQSHRAHAPARPQPSLVR